MSSERFGLPCARIIWKTCHARSETGLAADGAKVLLAGMCTRYTLQNLEALRALLAELGLAAPAGQSRRFNLPLTTRAPVVTRRKGVNAVESFAFGATLPPRTPTERPTLLGNARSETMLAKATFKDAAQHRRCLVPADGFFEWERAGAARLPHYFFRRDRRAFFFAGLWRPENEAAPASFVIVTTAPNALLVPIHDRMPVILHSAQDAAAWLGEAPLSPARLAALCAPLEASAMASHRVTPRMNNARFEDPVCIEPWTPPPAEPTLFDGMEN